MQRCKGVKKAKWVAQSKQGKHINIAQSGGRYVSSTPTPQRCISQVVTSKQTLGGMVVTMQASPRGAQSMAKSRSREANMEVKHRSEQANIDVHKGNDPNPLM